MYGGGVYELAEGFQDEAAKVHAGMGNDESVVPLSLALPRRGRGCGVGEDEVSVEEEVEVECARALGEWETLSKFCFDLLEFYFEIFVGKVSFERADSIQEWWLILDFEWGCTVDAGEANIWPMLPDELRPLLKILLGVNVRANANEDGRHRFLSEMVDSLFCDANEEYSRVTLRRAHHDNGARDGVV